LIIKFIYTFEKIIEKSACQFGKRSYFCNPLPQKRGVRSDGDTEAKFIESLRPAQDRRGVSRARERNLITKEHQREHQGGTRDSEEN